MISLPAGSRIWLGDTCPEGIEEFSIWRYCVLS